MPVQEIKSTTKDKKGIYIHIPFCTTKCSYCDFVSGYWAKDIQKQYIQSIQREINHFDMFYDSLSIHPKVKTNIYNDKNNSNYKDIDTIYIGGGTPSTLLSGGIEQILQTIHNNFNVDQNAEITIECNPNSVDSDKITEWINSGVNRVSMGLQTTNDTILQILNRFQTLTIYNASIQKLQKKFHNISIDIMFGLPNQTLKDITQTLQVVSQTATHISAYALELEEKTSLYNDIKNNRYNLPNDDIVAEWYDYIVDCLATHNFHRYEISNFSKPNLESRHNLKYWNNINYYGFGVSAHSKVGDLRYSNTNNLTEYNQHMYTNAHNTNSHKTISDEYALRSKLTTKDTNPSSKIKIQDGDIKQYEYLNTQTKLTEFFMLGLRQSKGLNIIEYQNTFGKGLETTHSQQLIPLLQAGILIRQGNFIQLAPNQSFILNQVIKKLI